MARKKQYTEEELKERRKATYKKYREKNIDKIRAKEKQDRIDHPEKYKDKQQTYLLNNSEQVKQNRKNWTEQNRDKVREQNRLNTQIHKDSINERKRISRLDPDYKEKERQYRLANRDKSAARTAKRRARKLLATPKWLTKDDWTLIDSFYVESSRLTRETGIRYAVDHIHPLQGKFVCGLHVPWNLQVLTDDENTRKGTTIPD